MTELFSTIHGSHIWKMDTHDSDVDLFRCFVQDNKTILSGRPYAVAFPQNKYRKDGIEHDESAWELAKLVGLLIKGNVNAIWMTTSPCVVRTSLRHQELVSLVKSTLSKSSYGSINGMAKSQYLDESKRPTMGNGKGLRTAMRTLQFGINMFDKGILSYEPVYSTPSEEEIITKFAELFQAMDGSSLPDEVCADPYYELVYRIRSEGDR